MELKQFNAEVGRRLREMRRIRGFTQEELGDEVDLSRTSITNFESGNQGITLWLAVRIAESLDCQIGDLLPASGANEGLPADVTPKTAALLRRLSVATP